ncbi:hypothetical protein Xcel_3476 (plasmid) [Xylanimonas cellulosilytica DSM 15894]|uniref:Uncharacterized protein n=1 Tax=Xylanimonas cellulosilytica (strain DSM 15894 / JCM 12276 / CECT 5975 / KCTC 9989 / LMG 20990 / NBRC 107835 / XIL07) TaxID=446471 RepID=D1C109_XYLCX|nr:hypothetical protein [Xylanimonas cellulosilytica]ACZ32475.1 hypothetical protein Xcel_3476 [Xylanimonas cellulosilytica DSM 15894]
MHVIAVIEPIPDDTNSAPAESREISVDAQEFQEGYDRLKGQVPEGWRISHVRRDAY